MGCRPLGIKAYLPFKPPEISQAIQIWKKVHPDPVFHKRRANPWIEFDFDLITGFTRTEAVQH
jgi:hypothetical protein